MLKLCEDLGRRGADALRARYGADIVPATIVIERSARADLQTAAALQLARTLRVQPRVLAEQLAAALAGSEAVAAASVAGAGFVNISLDEGWIASHARDGLELFASGAGRTVVVDYSSPNVAKPMHIGHIRSTIIGDAVKRTLRAVGYRVVADNHLGDWGTQFGKLIVAYRLWVDEASLAENPVEELLRLYVKYQEEEKKQRGTIFDPVPEGGTEDDEAPNDEATPLLKAARAELVKLQAGDADNVALWQQFVAVSMREFERVYGRLGVDFDVVLGESFYNDRLAPTVERLRAQGIAEESQGALVVTFIKERDGDQLPPFLIRKADGGYLYATTDIASVLYRIERWDPARILYVTDERQQLHFKQLFATARRLGIETSLEHVWFGLMRLPEGTISTREGKLIGLEALLDEAERRAADVARQCNPELDEEALREVARVVGIGAVKYNDLSRDRQTLVTFTWDKALSLTGNTAPYLQYAYARIRSILRKSAEQGHASGPVVSLSPTERGLVLRALGFASAVDEVARTARPHVLCEYLFELATAFSTFYNEQPVLKAEPEVRASRLALCELVAETLYRGLALLGIEVLDRM